ncbi:MAG: DUF692 domain-containing protein, partial [Betaproteobacteria bacterium]
AAANRPLLPASAGIGLRAPHVGQVLAELPPVQWFEVHSENYFAEGGPALAALDRIRADYPLSLHGVGLSLGSTDPLDVVHLAKLERLVDRVEPASISEHLCWSSVNGRHYNDLLPLPYTDEALDHVCARVCAVQDFLGRGILVENVSSYFAFPESTLDEAAFVASVAARTGCKLLLDVNNVYVNAHNHGIDADAYLAAIPRNAVAEMHLAGFDTSGTCLIDTHGAPVAPEVWALYARAIARFGPVPTLIEWDVDLPAFAVLQREAATAQAVLEAKHVVVA